MSRLGMTTYDLRSLLMFMLEIGEKVADSKKAQRKLPRSHILALSRFLLSWYACDDSSHVFLISGGDNPALEAYCLDPRDAADPLLACRYREHVGDACSS